MRFFLSTTLLVCMAMLFTACGYKPSSKSAREVVGEKISTSIIISSSDPENSVIIKNAIESAIIMTFHASLRKRVESDSHLEVSTSTPIYVPIEYDGNGFIIGYRMSIILNIKRYREGVSKVYISKGSHDFSITPNAIVTDQERFEAIKFSAQKAIRSFIAQVSAEGSRANKGRN